MRIFRAAALLLFLTAPAFGQSLGGINWVPDAKSRTPEEIEQDAARDKAYRESIRKIPDAKASSDPWGNVRAPEKRNTAAQQKQRAKSDPAASRQ